MKSKTYIIPFLSKRLEDKNGLSFSSLVAKIATTTIILGAATMILTLSILSGYKTAVREKIVSLGGHIIVTHYNTSNGYEDFPITYQEENSQYFKSHSLVSHLQPFGYKPSLLTFKGTIQGVVLKGIDTSFAKEKLKDFLIEGNWPKLNSNEPSLEILISKKIRQILKINVGDTLISCFLQNPPRFRKLKVSGVYQTGMEEFDESLIIGDLKLIQQLNKWEKNQAGGLEIFLKDFNKIDLHSDMLFEEMPPDWGMEKITDKHLQLFEWLNMLNSTAAIPIAIILVVAVFNMLSTLLIMIMERTSMIGTLKALGANDRLITSLFLYKGYRIVLFGLFYGNLLGLFLAALQYYTALFPLDPENYYLTSVPIAWPWLDFLTVNLAVVFAATVIFLIPITVISKMTPIKAIKFN